MKEVETMNEKLKAARLQATKFINNATDEEFVDLILASGRDKLFVIDYPVLEIHELIADQMRFFRDVTSRESKDSISTSSHVNVMDENMWARSEKDLAHISCYHLLPSCA